MAAPVTAPYTAPAVVAAGVEEHQLHAARGCFKAVVNLLHRNERSNLRLGRRPVGRAQICILAELHTMTGKAYQQRVAGMESARLGSLLCRQVPAQQVVEGLSIFPRVGSWERSAFPTSSVSSMTS